MPGYAMPAPGLVDLKRRRRVASRVLLSDARGGDTAKKNIAFDIIIIASRTLLKIGWAASVERMEYPTGLVALRALFASHDDWLSLCGE